MIICEQIGSHIGQQRQFDLEHFVFSVIRCSRCGTVLQTQTAVKEVKNETSS